MAEGTTYVPRVHQQINKVQKALAAEGISKAARNTQQNYSFRGIDDVYNAMSALLAEHDLVIVPHYDERTCVERETRNGGALFYVTVRGTFQIVDAVDGSFDTAGPFYGEAMDSADKATNKAMSAAMKYFFLQTFVIPTKGDNDADATTHEVKGKTPPKTDAAPEPVTEKECDDALTELTNAAVEGMQAMQAKWESLREPLRAHIRKSKDDAFKTIKKAAAANTAKASAGNGHATH